MSLPPHYPLQHLHPEFHSLPHHHPRPHDDHSRHQHHHHSAPSPEHHFRQNPEVVMVTSRCSTFMLTTAALFSGAFTLVTLALAVGTDYWLFMSEPYRVPADDLAKFNLTGVVETKVMVYLRSGLWSVCTINLREGNRGRVCAFDGMDCRYFGSYRTNMGVDVNGMISVDCVRRMLMKGHGQ